MISFRSYAPLFRAAVIYLEYQDVTALGSEIFKKIISKEGSLNKYVKRMILLEVQIIQKDKIHKEKVKRVCILYEVRITKRH